MAAALQPSLFDRPGLVGEVRAWLQHLVEQDRRPAAAELLAALEAELGVEARWDVLGVIASLAEDPKLTRADRGYFSSMLADGSLNKAMRGPTAPEREVASTIDALVRRSRAYRSSEAFREMIDFMGRFRDYAPFNNMLVRVQNPSCSFYATAADWQRRFGRSITEDARPMLILAPMHPVMLVYDLDQTEGPSPPDELLGFARFEGQWDPQWLERMVGNAAGHRIRVDFKPLSSTHGGFATLDRGGDGAKMRIAVHAGLDGPSRLGVLCHELAHVLLGHLGTDHDHWWPGRSNLSRAVVEIEAEAVAHIVTTRLGLAGSSHAYVSGYLRGGDLPPGVSLDNIAKVAGYLERMARETMPPRKPRPLTPERTA